MNQEGIGTNKKRVFPRFVFQRLLNLHLSSPWNALYGHFVVNKGWILHHLIFTYELFSLDPYIHSLGTNFQETIYNLFIFFHPPPPFVTLMGVLALFLQAINSQKEKLKIKSAKIKFLLRFSLARIGPRFKDIFQISLHEQCLKFSTFRFIL
jgi:hypothetical protein